MNQERAVLIVGNFLSRTGLTQTACEGLAQRIGKSGWSVVTTSGRTNRFPRMLDMLNTAWRRRNDYQLADLETFSGPAFMWPEAVAYFLRMLKKPYVVVLRGGNLPAFAQENRSRVSKLLESAAVVAAPSRYMQEAMRPFRSDIRLLPNAIDLPLYPFRVRTKPAPHLVWLRAFHTIYNPSLALRVMAGLLPRHPETRLTLVGPDKGDGSLQAFKREAVGLKLETSIEYAGLVPKADVPSWLNRGDIFINTTNIDNTPVSVIEAMACGLCVVSTNVGGIPYLLENEQDALLVPPNDAGAMANAVERILTEPGLAEMLSQNARRKVEAFDWKVVLPQWEALFTEVIERG